MALLTMVRKCQGKPQIYLFLNFQVILIASKVVNLKYQFISSLQQTCQVFFIVPTLQMRKQRLRESKPS